MSVYVSDFLTGDGSYTITHDDAPGGSHTGSVAPGSITLVPNADGFVNAQVIAVACPVAGCGSVSYHPIGGGAQPGSVQRLFVYHLMTHYTVPAGVQAFLIARGFPPAFPWVPPRGFAAAKALVKLYCILQDGPQRWQLEDVTQGG